MNHAHIQLAMYVCVCTINIQNICMYVELMTITTTKHKLNLSTIDLMHAHNTFSSKLLFINYSLCSSCSASVTLRSSSVILLSNKRLP